MNALHCAHQALSHCLQTFDHVRAQIERYQARASEEFAEVYDVCCLLTWQAYKDIVSAFVEFWATTVDYYERLEEVRCAGRMDMSSFRAFQHLVRQADELEALETSVCRMSTRVAKIPGFELPAADQEFMDNELLVWHRLYTDYVHAREREFRGNIDAATVSKCSALQLDVSCAAVVVPCRRTDA